MNLLAVIREAVFKVRIILAKFIYRLNLYHLADTIKSVIERIFFEIKNINFADILKIV